MHIQSLLSGYAPATDDTLYCKLLGSVVLPEKTDTHEVVQIESPPFLKEATLIVATPQT